jgi:hypothetical protein
MGVVLWLPGYLLTNRRVEFQKVEFDNSLSNQIRLNLQLDAKFSPVLYLAFIYSSTCFEGHHPIIRSSTSVVASSDFTFGAW